MRQKKILLNDFIRIKNKERIMEQERKEALQNRVELLPVIKMIEIDRVEKGLITKRDDENILAMVEAKDNSSSRRTLLEEPLQLFSAFDSSAILEASHE